jgi:hypothetical protein
LRAAPILLAIALLAVGGASSPVHLEPPFKKGTPDNWSFENNPIPRYADLSDEQRRKESQATDHLSGNYYCPAVVASRFNIYSNTYPRFGLMADDPRAFQRFLLSAAERTDHGSDVCFPSELLERVVGSGKNRCNFYEGKEDVDWVLQDDIDKVIDLIEARQIFMIERMILDPTLIKSNETVLDTKIYLMQLSEGRDWMQEQRERWRRQMLERDPERYQFIVEAAKDNDFRSVLRSNPPCFKD